MRYTVKRQGWPKGVDNVHADYELPDDTLRRGVNVDIFDSGKLRRRGGHTITASMTGAHSMWSDGAAAYYARNNTLNRFYENGVSTSLGSFQCSTNRVAFAKVDAEVYATCSTARVAVRNGAIVPWGINVPAVPPTIAATTGILPAGTYHAAVTYLTADGRESGASSLSSIVLATTGGVSTTALPVSYEAAVTKKRLYLSTTDGEVLYMAAEVSAASQFVTISTLPAGPELRTAYLVPPPLGVALAYYNGRIFIVDAADPTVVWFTEATDYGHVDMRKNFYKFGADVTMLAAVNDGLYVAADQTYFIAQAGSAEHFQRVVLEAGAVFGSAATIPNTTDAIWMSERGAVLGKDGGEVSVLSGAQVSTGGMIDGAALVREQNSIRQYVVVGSNSQVSALQAGSYAEAEIIRRSA